MTFKAKNDSNEPSDVGQGELVGLAEVFVLRLRLALTGNGRFSAAGVASAGRLPTFGAASSTPTVLLGLAGALGRNGNNNFGYKLGTDKLN